VKFRILTGVAVAALNVLALPAQAATSPELASATNFDPSAERAISSFYAARGNSPLWLANGSAARELITVLERATLDGMSSGPAGSPFSQRDCEASACASAASASSA